MISVPPPSDADQKAAQQELPGFLNPQQFEAFFSNLHSNFTSIVIPVIEANRDARDMIVDVASLQNNGVLLPHQTYIPQRIIDINISRELPDHISYLTQSRRIAIFEALNKQAVVSTNTIEMEFKRVMTYDDWITSYERWADCTKLHGYGFVDVSYDPEMPGAVGVEFITAGNLLFDPRVKCIQQSPMIARRYEITSVDLDVFAKDYEFDPVVVDEIQRKLTEQEKSPTNEMAESACIYSVFFKNIADGLVYRAWWSWDTKKFLKPAEPFWNGLEVQKEIEAPPVVDPNNPAIEAPTTQLQWEKVYETEYPFFVYRNRVTEEEPIIRTMGRGVMDYYTQEAASALWSALVNGTTEASNVMWSPKNPNQEAPTAPKQLELIVKHGAIWNSPMEAFTAPYPPANLPQVLDALRTQNAEDTNQVSFATNNRRDTRKTATEIEAAQQQDTQMSSISQTNWATAIGGVLNKAWGIIKAQALKGTIVFCPLGDGSQGNDIALISQPYKIIPAGTVDYVERMEMIQSMQTDWPIVGPTPCGQVFLEEYLRVKYPLIADKLIKPLEQQQQQAAQVLQAVLPLLQQAVTDESGNLRPEWQSHAAELASLGIKPGGGGQLQSQPQAQPQTQNAQPKANTANPVNGQQG